MKIAVVLPTRGIVLTEVLNALLEELSSYDYKIYMSWNLGIPDGHNTLTKQAIMDGYDYILFIEEDNVIPKGSLKEMLELDGDIVPVDYGVSGWSCITKYKGEAMWCGLGCTLVKRNVFEALEYPYFRSDKLLLLNEWPEIKWIDAGNQVYGGQDIYFCIKAREKGFKITQASGESRHLLLDNFGKKETNTGCHRVIDKPRISKHNEL